VYAEARGYIVSLRCEIFQIVNIIIRAHVGFLKVLESVSEGP